MARMVQCVKLNKEAEGLLVPPIPGPKGQWIFDNICKEAWAAWQAHQTRLINEKHLSLLQPEDRKYLTEQMEKYFANQEVDAAEGFVPETK